MLDFDLRNGRSENVLGAAPAVVPVIGVVVFVSVVAGVVLAVYDEPKVMIKVCFV